MQRRVYLDTHVVVWLFDGETERFSEKVQDLINDNDLFISEIVRLELAYLYEIKRITEKPDTIINFLADEINQERCKRSLSEVTTEALFQTWTRDPFDRLITATAAIDNDYLITFDEQVLKNYKHALKE